jgi:hypothetical protein
MRSPEVLAHLAASQGRVLSVRQPGWDSVLLASGPHPSCCPPLPLFLHLWPHIASKTQYFPHNSWDSSSRLQVLCRVSVVCWGVCGCIACMWFVWTYGLNVCLCAGMGCLWDACVRGVLWRVVGVCVCSMDTGMCLHVWACVLGETGQVWSGSYRRLNINFVITFCMNEEFVITVLWASAVAHVVEWLPSKWEAISSNPSTIKKN